MENETSQSDYSDPLWIPINVNCVSKCAVSAVGECKSVDGFLAFQRAAVIGAYHLHPVHLLVGLPGHCVHHQHHHPRGWDKCLAFQSFGLFSGGDMRGEDLTLTYIETGGPGDRGGSGYVNERVLRSFVPSSFNSEKFHHHNCSSTQSTIQRMRALSEVTK